MRIELYPHNEKTYNNIIEMWNETDRVAAIQPTGTGKSFLILKCAEYFEGQNKIILAPSNYILEQLVKQYGKSIDNTILMTYATLQNLSEDDLKELGLSLIMLDEFHRCGAEEWGKGVQRLLEVYSNSKVLGTSATPIRYLDNARDMSEELFNGSVACNMTLPQAIVKGILPMPKYVSALYTFEDEANNMIDKVNKSKNTDEEKRLIIKDIEKLKNKLDKSKGIPKILQKYITNYSGKYLVFCKDKEHMDEMKDIVIGWFKLAKSSVKIVSYEVYSQSKESDKQLELFGTDNSENTLKLLFSIDMLNEGLHIKSLDGVILLRPTTSPIIYYQQIGRAIDAGKKVSPLVLDFVNNFDNIKINSFKNDLIITARECYRNNSNDFSNEEDFVSKFMVYDETFDVINLFNEIENNLCDNWDLNIKALEKFFNREGHSNVPIRHNELVEEKNIKLGNFCCKIRRLYNGTIAIGCLTEDRIYQLNKFNFSFSLKSDPHNWDYGYDMLTKWYKQFGEININEGELYNEFNLWSWVEEQKKKYKNNKLTQEQIEKLKAVNFIFDLHDCQWKKKYDHLLNYYNLYGNSDVPHKYMIENVNLGMWVSYQRSAYKKSKLNKEQINKLNEVDFKFIVGKNETQKIMVICLDTKEIFKTVTISANKYSTYATLIVKCCRGKRKTTGKLPDGTKLHWMYLDEYLILHPEEAETLKEAV